MSLSSNSVVTAIIPTKNTASQLEACLSSVRGQTYPHLEIIVVTPSRREDLDVLLEKYAATPLICPWGKNACRNYGAKKAQGTYLLHLDDDMQLEPEVIQECVTLAREQRKQAVAIPEVEMSGSGFYKRIRTLEKQIVYHDRTIEAPRFVSAEIYRQVGGITVELDPIDEGDLKEKLAEHGITHARTTSVIRVSHLSDRNILVDRWVRFYYRGKKRSLFNALHPGSKQLKPYERIKPYFHHGKILLMNPLAGTCLIVIKFLDLCALGLGQVATSL
jgi:glycosyltransferase involved in cell wall biosynthesis